MENYFFKFMKYFSALVLIGMFGALCQVAWWTWYPYDIVEFENHCCNEDGTYYNGIVLNDNKQVKRGEFLHAQLSFNKKMDITAKDVVRQLMNDRYVTLVCNESGTLPTGKQTKKFTIFIPMNVWPGKYRLMSTFVYFPNPIRPIQESWSTEWFEVLP